MKVRRSLPTLIALCLLVFTAATPRAQTPASTAPAQAPALSMPGFPAPGQPAKVTVVGTGAAPKKALRYTVPATFKGSLEIVTSMNMSMNVMGQAMDMPVPAIRMGLNLAVTSVAPNGDITYSMAFTGMKLDGDASNPVAMQLQAATAGIANIKGSATMNNRGLITSSKLDAGDPALQAMLSQMTSSVENLSTAFPEEAVGVGAKWEVRQALTSGGQTQFQKSIYEVTAITGATVNLKVTTETSAPPQTINNPMAAAAGGEMTLEKMTGSGAGTMTIQLDSLTPTSSIEQTTSTAMTMSIQGQSMPITSDGKIKITVAPVK